MYYPPTNLKKLTKEEETEMPNTEVSNCNLDQLFDGAVAVAVAFDNWLNHDPETPVEFGSAEDTMYQLIEACSAVHETAAYYVGKLA